MKIITLLTLFLLIALSGCLKSFHDIQPISENTDSYKNMTCSQLEKKLKENVTHISLYSDVYHSEEETESGKLVKDILLGGYQHRSITPKTEKIVAKLKGNIIDITNIKASKNCISK